MQNSPRNGHARRLRRAAAWTLAAALTTAALSNTSASRLVGLWLGSAAAAAPLLAANRAALVTTDKTDYQPGETVVISGSGWAAGETVSLTLREDPARHADTALSATADEYGNILNKDFSPTSEHLGTTFTLTATGQTSGRTAAATFTDGGAMNYSPNNQPLNIQSDASPQSASFLQTVSAPRGNGNFTAALQVTGTGLTPLPAAWVSASPDPLSYSTGTTGPPTVFFPQTRTVTVTVPPFTPAGTYTGQIRMNPSITGVGLGPGTNLSVVVTADNAPPNTTLTATTPPSNPYNGVDWTNQDVTITLGATDTGTPATGVADTKYKVDSDPYQTYTAPFTISSEGLHTVTYFSTDNSGNVEGGQTFTVKIDKTAPAPNCASADGVWHADNVSINCTPTDSGGSGLVSPGDITLMTSVSAGDENANAATGSQPVCDNAGNCASAGPVGGNMVDKKAPNVTASAAKADSSVYNAGDWTNQNVTVSFQCTDGGSGVASVDGPSTLSAEGANQSATGNCADNVGNASQVVFQPIRIDKTAPSISASRTPPPNGFGWNNTDVTASYNASDALSGLVEPPSGSHLFNAEGANQSHTFTVQDLAGNSNSATVGNVNIDKTAPSVNITSPNAGPYLLNQTVAASYNCNDGGNPPSGVDTCTGTVASGANINTSSVGPHTFSVTATDKAGNTANDSRTYGVIYDWSGYLQPINVNGSSVFKLGSTIPVKFQLTGGSAGVVGATNFKLYVAKVSNNVVGSEVEAVTSTPASTGNLFRYDPSGGIYIYNMGTKGVPWSAGTWQLRVDLGDGATNRTVLISIKP